MTTSDDRIAAARALHALAEAGLTGTITDRSVSVSRTVDLDANGDESADRVLAWLLQVVRGAATLSDRMLIESTIEIRSDPAGRVVISMSVPR